jgi:hypothetical protein
VKIITLTKLNSVLFLVLALISAAWGNIWALAVAALAAVLFHCLTVELETNEILEKMK